jgi:branched-chain amino acid transport system permease protein
MVGAVVVRLLPLLLSSYTDRWQTIVGLIFILFVLFAPQGILGFLRRERRRGL